MSIKLSLFGKCKLEGSTTTTDIKFPSKLMQLLALLAVQRAQNVGNASAQAMSRIEVARILWESDDEEVLLSRLRRLLYKFRKSIEGHIDEDLVIATQDSLTLSDTVVLDIELFESHLKEESATSLQAAGELYQGTFVEDLQSDVSMQFDNWLEEQRNYYREQVLGLYRKLVPKQLDGTSMAEIRKNISAWLSLDNYEEQAHRLMMESYIKENKRNKAIAYYNDFRSFLQDDIGLEPDPQTQALFQQILRYKEPRIEATASIAESKPFNKNKAVLVKTISTQSLHEEAERRFEDDNSTTVAKLPVQLTSFVGREKESQDIKALLQENRLVSILGTGGIGKTRLAQAVAEQSLEHFSDGVYFIALADATKEQFIAKVATDLRLEPNATTEDIVKFLSRKNILIVFDNCEHLAGSYGFFQDLLEGCQNIKLLATSRQRLKLIGEQIVDLQGLSFPTSDEDIKENGYSAIKLFLQRARLVDRNFELDTVRNQQVTDICRMLQGLPLAIELAAAWVRNLTVDEIQDEIKKNLDFLQGDAGQRPERQQSLAGVFEYSWNLLSESEKAVFSQLAIFEASVSRNAAAEVAGASIQDLANLVDKSLLQVYEKGRYRLHQLLKQYAFEKLNDSGNYEATLESFRKFYVVRAKKWIADVESAKQDSAVKHINDSYEDILKLWHEALTREWFESLVVFSNCLLIYSQYRLAHRHIHTMLMQAIKDSELPEEPILSAKLQIIYAQTALSMSQYEVARESIESAYSTFVKAEDYFEAFDALYLLVSLEYELGNYQAGLQHAEKAEELLSQIKEKKLKVLEDTTRDVEIDRMQLEGSKALIFEKLGHFDLAEELLLVELKGTRVDGGSVYLADCICNVAGFYIDNGRVAEGKPYLDEVEQLKETMQSDYRYVPYSLYQGIYYFLVNEIELAFQWLKDSKQLADESENIMQPFATAMLARVYCSQGNGKEGLELIGQVAEMLRRTDIKARALRTILEVAHGFQYLSKLRLAAELYNFIIKDSRSSFREREIAQSQLELLDSVEVSKVATPSSVQEICNLIISELTKTTKQDLLKDLSESNLLSDSISGDNVLSDAQWQKLKPLLPPQPETGRKRKQDREVLNSYLYKLKTGKAYKDIPKDSAFASASTTQRWIETWRQEAEFELIETFLKDL